MKNFTSKLSWESTKNQKLNAKKVTRKLLINPPMGITANGAVGYTSF